MCMIHVCIVYLYGMCMHALMCECGYPCVEFRGRLGCWSLASALRQVPFVTHSCVRLTGWKASRMILSSHSISSMVLGAYTHVQYITWCWEHIHTQLYEDAGIHTQIFTLGQQANALLTETSSHLQNDFLKCNFLHSTFSCINIIFPSL